MERLAGVDALRGLAVLGMFAAHVGYAADEFWTSTGWLAVAEGRSSATFALLAGVSIALMAGGPRAAGHRAPEESAHGGDGTTPPAIWRRILARAVVVAVIGYGLVLLGTPIAVILPAYALMFVLLLPFVGAPPRRTAVAAGIAALLGPVLVQAVGGRAPGLGVDAVGLLLTGYYPVAVWMAYGLVGLAVGRLSLRSPGTLGGLGGLGAGLALAAYGFGALAVDALPAAEPWLSIEPHADTTPEVVGNIGVSLLLLALLQWLAGRRAGRPLLTPLAATGAMALTVYTVQIVAIALMGPDVVYEQTSNGTLIAFTVVTLTACTLWVRLLGRGPLERLMRAVAGATTAPRVDLAARP